MDLTKTYGGIPAQPDPGLGLEEFKKEMEANPLLKNQVEYCGGIEKYNKIRRVAESMLRPLVMTGGEAGLTPKDSLTAVTMCVPSMFACFHNEGIVTAAEVEKLKKNMITNIDSMMGNLGAYNEHRRNKKDPGSK